MKFIKFCLFLVVSFFFSYEGLASKHPEANFGEYGIKHYSTIGEYQRNYIGRMVKYLPANKDGNSFDRECFLNDGGEFGVGYVISKIIGDDERMTFLLMNINNAKKKVKMIINNEDLYYSYGKDTYCITNSYTVPLFLVEKYNEDKSAYIGKTFNNGELEIKDIRLNDNYVTDSHKAYPKVEFVIKDNYDGSSSFVEINCKKDINDLGKIFTNPFFKCNYKVVGISKGNKDTNLLGKDTVKYYRVKNSISGKTKMVEAKNASVEAFKGDDSGKFLSTLSKVEKPSNPSIRYGTTTTVTEKDITKYSYVDNFIDILIFTTNDQFNFVLKNVSDNSLKLIWNEAVFVDVDGSTSKVMHAGIKYSQREADQPALTIIKGAKLEDLAAPTANVYYNETLKDWKSRSIFNHADKKKEGQTIKLMLPIQVKDVVNEYIFEFSISYVFDHPEYIAY